MKKLMPSEGLRLGCSSGSTRCVIAKNYVLGQPGGAPTSQIVKVQPNEIYHQQELMYYDCSYSAFSNIGKKGSGIVSFLCQVFQVYFPAGEYTPIQ